MRKGSRECGKEDLQEEILGEIDAEKENATSRGEKKRQVKKSVVNNFCIRGNILAECEQETPVLAGT